MVWGRLRATCKRTVLISHFSSFVNSCLDLSLDVLSFRISAFLFSVHPTDLLTFSMSWSSSAGTGSRAEQGTLEIPDLRHSLLEPRRQPLLPSSSQMGL